MADTKSSKSLKICMVSSEAGPYVRTGGLGDVLGALPAALAALGHDVRVFVPLYALIDRARHHVSPIGHSFQVPINGSMHPAMLHRAREAHDGAQYFFVENELFFDRGDLYRNPATGKDYEDNDIRFAFFARGVLEAVRHVNWQPDVLHVHDWQASLVPAYLQTAYAGNPFFAAAKSVLTIHNLGYQGMFGAERFARLGLPDSLMYAVSGALEFYGKVNYLKGGIALADKITTVSRRYAQEICTTDEFGFGLQGVLNHRKKDLHGILNGVDYSLWSPSRDRVIPAKFSISNLSGKRTCRVELLNRAGLPIREQVPLIGMITRLTDQKGVDLVCEAANQLFSRDLQIIVLGVGDDLYHEKLKTLQQTYPDRLKVYLEFNDTLAHWIQAGSDMFLMPSRYEPCGLNQMYALRYGTVPVVRSVGGLADTVDDYVLESGTGTGFVFSDYSAGAMIEAIDRALDLFHRRQRWVKLMKAGMKRDFSWSQSAKEYSNLYRQLATGK